MAKELKVVAPTGWTVYVLLLNSTGQAWNTATPAFETFAVANWTSYKIALSESSTSGVYFGDFPSVSTLGTYDVVGYKQLGGSAASTDTFLGSEAIAWDGSKRNIAAKADSTGGVALQSGQVVGSVTSDVGITQAAADKVWNTTSRAITDKAGFSLASSQSFSTSGSVGSVGADVGITQAAADKVWNTTSRAVTDKAGFSLASSQSFSTSGSVGSVAGSVTVGTNSDKSGYSLTSGEHTAIQADSYNALNQAMPTTPTSGSAFDRIKSYLNASVAAVKSVTDVFTFTGSDVNASVDGAVVVSGNVTVGGYATGQDPATYILQTPANKLDTDSSGRVNLGKWLGSVVNSLISGRVDANAQVVGDGTFSTTGSVGSVNSPVQLDYEQELSLSPTVGTVGEALAAARAQGFGKWSISGSAFRIYAHDGTTLIKEFTLNSATSPTSRS